MNQSHSAQPAVSEDIFTIVQAAYSVNSNTGAITFNSDGDQEKDDVCDNALESTQISCSSPAYSGKAAEEDFLTAISKSEDFTDLVTSSKIFNSYGTNPSESSAPMASVSTVNQLLAEDILFINEMRDKLYLSADISDKTVAMYKLLTSRVQISHKRYFSSTIAAIFYILSSQMQNPKSFGDIQKAFTAKRKGINRMYLLIKKTLPELQIVHPKPSDLVDEICDQLHLSCNLVKHVKDFVKRIEEESGAPRMNPRSLVGGSVFVVCRLFMAGTFSGRTSIIGKFIKQIAIAAKVYPATIRRTYDLIWEREISLR